MKNTTTFAPDRALDVICLGRLAVDLYAQQIGARLEDVSSFAKYLGGSAANAAFGAARLGLRSAMLTRVGDDHMGRFLTDALQAEGCDTSQVKRDPRRLTALAILGLEDQHTFPLMFYRENCADMAITAEDVDEAFIASSRALLISGTHLSTAGVHGASMQALRYAREHDVRTVLDIDYRPVLWGLTARGDGATRFVSNAGVTAHLQAVLPMFDLVVGTEEEFQIAGGSEDIDTALRAVRAVTSATLVIKLGPLGCAVIAAGAPASLAEAFHFRGVEVEVMNVLGAGDAFMSGFLRGWIRGEDIEQCCRLANACGALVVARHACAPAMPTMEELDYFFEHSERLREPGKDVTLNRLHRTTVPRPRWDELCVFAFDHRNQFFDLARQEGASEERITELKALLLKAAEEAQASFGLAGKFGILVDDRYGRPVLEAATGRGWWIGRPVELPGSNPLQFEWGRSIGSHLQSWPREHTIKCLVQLHPDDTAENRLEQEAQVQALYQAAQVSGHELLLEIIPPRHLGGGPDVVYRAIKRLYNIGVYPEWWKLEGMDAAQWNAIAALIAERDPRCRGVVLLGLNASPHELAQQMRTAAATPVCRGFMVGRTIFQEPSRRWLAGEISDAACVAEVRANFGQLVETWRAMRPQGAR
jgi:5-dehydro-2-deoxygluconokinase